MLSFTVGTGLAAIWPWSSLTTLPIGGASTGGKPPTLLRLHPPARYSVGVLLERNTCVIVVVDLAGRQVAWPPVLRSALVDALRDSPTGDAVLTTPNAFWVVKAVVTRVVRGVVTGVKRKADAADTEALAVAFRYQDVDGNVVTVGDLAGTSGGTSGQIRNGALVTRPELPSPAAGEVPAADRLAAWITARERGIPG